MVNSKQLSLGGWLLAFVVLVPFLFVGCVRRRLTVRTNPVGASVYMDKQFIGTSPASVSATYYGVREIEVVADGYRTEKIMRKFSPPWYQIPPLDFLSETLWPREIRDERVVDIAMVPAQVAERDVVLASGQELRLQARQRIATPLPPTVSGGSSFQDPNQSGGLAQPIDPGFYPNSQPPIVTTPPVNQGPAWQPGQFLQEFVQPGGSPPTRIPETGILPGGGYRPNLPSPSEPSHQL